MTDATRLDRLAARYVAWRFRHVREDTGRLVWVDSQGRASDLGAYTRGEIEGVCGSVDIARRTSPLVGERARLSGFTHAARRLRAAIKKVAD